MEFEGDSCRKAQPDIEGIETVSGSAFGTKVWTSQSSSDSSSVGRKAQPDIEGIETRVAAEVLKAQSRRKAQSDMRA